MLTKNLIRIINSYKFSLIIVIFFELLYLILGYKGNRFNFSKDIVKSDNLPCPYYFLFKIKKILHKTDFYNFLDLGCGSGRVIDVFNKNFADKNLTGIEYFEEQYKYSQKIFCNEKNIKIIKEDFTKINFLQYNIDCFFFNEPFKKNSESIAFIEKIVNLPFKKKIIFIFVNGNRKIIDQIKNINCIESFYVSDNKGYSIYSSKES